MISPTHFYVRTVVTVLCLLLNLYGLLLSLRAYLEIRAQLAVVYALNPTYFSTDVDHLLSRGMHCILLLMVASSTLTLLGILLTYFPIARHDSYSKEMCLKEVHWQGAGVLKLFWHSLPPLCGVLHWLSALALAAVHTVEGLLKASLQQVIAGNDHAPTQDAAADASFYSSSSLCLLHVPTPASNLLCVSLLYSFLVLLLLISRHCWSIRCVHTMSVCVLASFWTVTGLAVLLSHAALPCMSFHFSEARQQLNNPGNTSASFVVPAFFKLDTVQLWVCSGLASLLLLLTPMFLLSHFVIQFSRRHQGLVVTHIRASKEFLEYTDRTCLRRWPAVLGLLLLSAALACRYAEFALAKVLLERVLLDQDKWLLRGQCALLILSHGIWTLLFLGLMCRPNWPANPKLVEQIDMRDTASPTNHSSTLTVTGVDHCSLASGQSSQQAMLKFDSERSPQSVSKTMDEVYYEPRSHFIEGMESPACQFADWDTMPQRNTQVRFCTPDLDDEVFVSDPTRLYHDVPTSFLTVNRHRMTTQYDLDPRLSGYYTIRRPHLDTAVGGGDVDMMMMMMNNNNASSQLPPLPPPAPDLFYS